jgi:hypothetical protein
MWQETKRIFLDSSGSMLREAARLLPSVIAMLFIFLIFAVLAITVRAGVLRVCDRLALDRRLREWGVAGKTSVGGASPALLVARVAFWTVLVAGIFFGMRALDTPGAAALSARLLDYAPRALVALVIIAVGLGLARVIERNVLIGAVNMGLQSARLLALGGRWLVVILAAAIALEHAGVGTSVVTVSIAIVFGGIVLALALAVGLGAKDLVARSLERRFREGDPTTGKQGDTEEQQQGQVHHL